MSDEQQDTATKTSQPTTKNGEESFNEEIKDYAKTTMNELLGMFGYDDEITSESVNNLDIKVPSTTEESSSANSVVNTMASITADTVTTSNTNTPSIPLNIPDDTSDVPVIVKVEGNTSVNDIIRKQIGDTSKTNGTTPAQVTLANQTIVTAAQPQTIQPSSMNITMTTQSQTGQPSLAPHFYAVPPAVRGVYCVVANLPLVVNQNKSAMTFKFWNCITCSEYFLEKPEIVFRIHYPHLFTGQPEWLYQAAVCLKCYHHLVTTVHPQTTTIPASLAQATFTVIDCKMEGKEKDTRTTAVYTTASLDAKEVASDSVKERKSPNNGHPPSSEGNPPSNKGNPPLSNGNTHSSNRDPHERKGNLPLLDTIKDNNSMISTNGNSPDVSNGSDSFMKDINGNPKQAAPNFSTSNGNRLSQIPKGNFISINSPPLQENHTLSKISIGDSHCPISPNLEQEMREVSKSIDSLEENVEDTEESYKCYVCNLSVSVTSQQGKLRRSKFPSLFTNVADNVGHFKVCQGCCDHLHHQRDLYIKANIPDNKRDYNTNFCKSDTKSANECFICEATFNDREPSRPIYRSRYPSLFRGLPGHTIHIPICDKCYKKLQKIKLRFDSNEHEESTRNYVEFVNMWRAKRGLGKHPLLV